MLQIQRTRRIYAPPVAKSDPEYLSADDFGPASPGLSCCQQLVLALQSSEQAAERTPVQNEESTSIEPRVWRPSSSYPPKDLRLQALKT